jgi:hypothetical protein
MALEDTNRYWVDLDRQGAAAMMGRKVAVLGEVSGAPAMGYGALMGNRGRIDL